MQEDGEVFEVPPPRPPYPSAENLIYTDVQPRYTRYLAAAKDQQLSSMYSVRTKESSNDYLSINSVRTNGPTLCPLV